MVLGVIPKCPTCGGGRPKYQVCDTRKKIFFYALLKTFIVPRILLLTLNQNGFWFCEGYRDDTDWTDCHFVGTEITREAWLDEEI